MDIFFIILSAVLYAVVNIIDARLINIFKRIPTMLFYNGITNCIIIPVVFLFGTPKFLPLDSIATYCLILSAAIEIIYQIPYLKSLKIIDTSIVAALFSLGKITVPVMAYFMVGEQLTTTQYIGFFVIILFNLLLNTSFSNIQKHKFLISAGFWLMLVSSILVSLLSVLNKKVLVEIDWITFVFWYAVITTVFSWGILLIPGYQKDIKHSFKIYKKSVKSFIYLEIFAQLAALLVKVALVTLPVVVYVGLSSTQPIFSLLIGIAFFHIYGDKFKENIDKKNVIKKLICFIFIILGAVLTV